MIVQNSWMRALFALAVLLGGIVLRTLSAAPQSGEEYRDSGRTARGGKALSAHEENTLLLVNLPQNLIKKKIILESSYP